MSKSIVVVAAHSDDEALGCGGTIARHSADGDIVHLVFLADGVSSRPGNDDVLRQREAAAAQAHQILGVRSTHYLAFPDNRLDSVPLLDIVKKLEDVLALLAPEIIYTHHHGDLNVDHRITHEAVMTACRPLPGSSVKEIYAFEVMSSTEWSGSGNIPFTPQLTIDISAYLEAKLAALKAYEIEMRPQPHSRSIEHLRALALHRGHSAGMYAGESFMVVRQLR
ncbi:PIG-L deacetylase family protein [Herbaspirillum seropedicae]|uniref:PIG-L deacetylase family protein n=1 Tax=Herbaspirillum seropedicae TaxID=964 RepID=UPI003F8D03F7